MVARMRKANPSAKPNAHALRSARRAFTLMELMTVVVILGVLASLITFAVMWAIKAAERAAFAENLRQFANAAHMYRTEYGYYPSDAEPGELPPGFAKYIDADKWGQPTPFGGKWDVTRGDPGAGGGGGGSSSMFGIGVAMDDGVVDDSGDVVREQIYASLSELDDDIDDGDLNTGHFRRIGQGSFYLVIAE